MKGLIKRLRKNKKGFTLIELIVVIAIIGVLMAILIPTMTGYVRNSRITTANANAKQVAQAAQTYITSLDARNTRVVAAGGNFTATTAAGGQITAVQSPANLFNPGVVNADIGDGLEAYLGATFTGSFAVTVDPNGTVTKVTWSAQMDPAADTDPVNGLVGNNIVGEFPVS